MTVIECNRPRLVPINLHHIVTLKYGIIINYVITILVSAVTLLKSADLSCIHYGTRRCQYLMWRYYYLLTYTTGKLQQKLWEYLNWSNLFVLWKDSLCRGTPEQTQLYRPPKPVVVQFVVSRCACRPVHAITVLASAVTISEGFFKTN